MFGNGRSPEGRPTPEIEQPEAANSAVPPLTI
jgi:hypothetical protein